MKSRVSIAGILSLPLRSFGSFLQFLLRTWKEFNRNNGLIRASGLAYSTLLALVPLSVVIFSLVSAFGALDDLIARIQDVLVNILVPTRQVEVLMYIRRFIENAQTYGFLGFIFFALTSVLLMASIENNFNEIWGTRPPHRFGRRLTTYTSVLVLGTLLIGASFTLSAWISASSRHWAPLSALIQLFLQAFPLLFMFLAFLLMIMLIPSADVHFGSALVGAAAGAVLWEAARWGFATWANLSVRSSAIYGSLALIPIFLIWLNLAWAIVLFALEITFVHQEIRKPSIETFIPVRHPADRMFLGFGIFLLIARRFHDGGEPPSREELSSRFSASPAEIERLIELFQAHRLLLVLDQPRWGAVPARCLDTITLQEIARVLYGTGAGDGHPAAEAPVSSRHEGAARVADSFSRAAYEALAGRTVEDLMESDGS